MGFIRLYLALGVVFLHAGAFRGVTLISGFDAVPIFFMISGFYMSLALNHKYTEYRPFITNRILKLYPLYLLMLIACIIADHGGETLRLFLAGKVNLVSFVTLLFYNFIGVGSELISISTLSETGSLNLIALNQAQDIQAWNLLLIGPVWSLSVEFWFYLIAPFVLKRNKNYILKFSVFVLIGVLYRCFLYSTNHLEIPWSYNLFPAAIIFFALGSISYSIYTCYAKFRNIEALKRWVNIGEYIVFALTLYFLFSYNSISQGSRLWIMIFLICLTMPAIYFLTKKNTLDTFLGDLSYPIYVSHFLFARYWIIPGVSHPVIPTLVASTVLVFTVVRPIQRYKSAKTQTVT